MDNRTDQTQAAADTGRRTSRRGKWRRRLVYLLGVFALIGLTVYVSVPARWWEAVALVRGLGSLTGETATGATAAPIERRFTVDDRDYRADLYGLNSGTARGVLILVPGASPAGKDDRRLVALARKMAQHGFLVLVPDLVALRKLDLGPANIRPIGAAILYGRRLADRRNLKTVGLFAISYSVGPALLALKDRRIDGALDYLVGLGGYYDLRETMRFVATGHYRLPKDPPGTWRRKMAPDPRYVWRFIYHNSIHLKRPRDQVAMLALAQVKFTNPDAPAGPFLTHGPAADFLAVYRFGENRDPDRFPALLAALPQDVRRVFDEMDLRRTDLTRIKSRMILIHGDDDRVIPAGESRRLQAALSGARVLLFRPKAMRHAALGGAAAADAFTVWRASVAVLEARDGVLIDR